MLDDPIVRHSIVAILIIVVSAALGKLVDILVKVASAGSSDDTASGLNGRILATVESKIIPLSLIAGFSLAIREVRKGVSADNITAHQVLDYLSVTLFILLIIILFHLISRLFKSTMEWYAASVSLKNRANIAPTIVPFTTKIANIVLFFIVGMIVLDHLGVNIGGLLVSLGVGSLAIALAAQETIANMIAWFVILVDQPIRIGDRIRLPSGDEGEVHEIGLRSTRILNPDNNLVIIPNGDLVKGRIINLSYPDSGTRIVLEVNVAYGTDLEKSRQILLRFAGLQTDIEKGPRVFLTNFGSAGVQLRLHARTPDYRRKFEIETGLREQIYTSFSQAGIEITPLHRFMQNPDYDATQTVEKK